MEAKKKDLANELLESNTGRWTKAEHELFLRGLSEFGKDWKQIGQLIKTRTVVQIRTHAQKYFLAHKKQEHDHDQESLIIANLTSKASSNKKRVPLNGTKTKSKKKKEDEGVDNFDKIFDLVDAWSSGSDEGTPTSVDEMDFLKGPILQSFPMTTAGTSETSQREAVASNDLTHTSLPMFQPAHPTMMVNVNVQHSFIQTHRGLEREIEPSQFIPSTSQPISRITFDPSPVGEITSSDLQDLANTLDPLPPSLEYVLLGRWMDTMNE